MRTLISIILSIFAFIEISKSDSLHRIESINPGSVTVGGISTGGAFASQFLVAHSSLVKGAGIYAAITNYCFYFHNSSFVCRDFPEEIAIENLIEQTLKLQESNWIDATSNLKEARVFVAHGMNDGTVNPGFAPVTQKYYGNFGSSIEMLTHLPANHAVMTDGRGTECGTFNPPLIVEDCGFESVEAMFNHLYEDMKPGVEHGKWQGELIEFDQVCVLYKTSNDLLFTKFLKAES